MDFFFTFAIGKRTNTTARHATVGFAHVTADHFVAASNAVGDAARALELDGQ